MKLSENSSMPLYQQLMEEIKLLIEEGKYCYGDKIPSESEMNELYGVSRITIRRAIEELCAEGYLEKIHGKGTYVSKQKKVMRKILHSTIMSFSACCRECGMTPSSKMIKVEETLARKDEQRFFQIGEEDHVLYTQRVLSADDTPVMLENNFFSKKRFGDLNTEELNGTSLFQLLHDKYGIDVSDTQSCTLEIVYASPEQAELLAVKTGEALFYMNAYFIDEKGEPLFIGRQYIAGNRYIFNI